MIYEACPQYVFYCSVFAKQTLKCEIKSREFACSIAALLLKLFSGQCLQFSLSKQIYPYNLIEIQRHKIPSQMSSSYYCCHSILPSLGDYFESASIFQQWHLQDTIDTICKLTLTCCEFIFILVYFRRPLSSNVL